MFTGNWQFAKLGMNRNGKFWQNVVNDQNFENFRTVSVYTNQFWIVSDYLG